MRTSGGDRATEDDAAAAAAPSSARSADVPPAPALPATPAAPQAAQIDYSRTQFYVTRRQWRVLVALTLFNTVALAWFAFGPNSSQFIQAQWQQWQAKRAERAKLRQVVADQRPCLDFVMPPEQLVYEEDPPAALKLTSANPGFAPVRMRVDNLLATTAPWASPAQRIDVPAEWATFARRGGEIENGLGCSATLPVLFLGTRRAKGGETLLLVVQFEAQVHLNAGAPKLDVRRFNPTRRLIVSCFRPGTRDAPPKRLGTSRLNLFLPASGARVNDAGDAWVLTRPAMMALFTGQADPADPSHFTIPYQVNGFRGVIDGWLRPEGPLLRPRTGEAVNFGGGQRAWNLPVPPATQPQHWHIND